MTDQIISPLFLVTETPLHAGSGDSLGIVDLPIQRERHTGFPKVESSSLKGALREAIETKIQSQNFSRWDDLDVKTHRVFGFDEGSLNATDKKNLLARFETSSNGVVDKGIEFTGCLKMTDARLLLFPVKSIKGVFAWVTCPKVLAQLAQDMRLHDPEFSIENVPAQFSENQCYLLHKNSKLKFGDHIVLEEYAFHVAGTVGLTTPNMSLVEWLKIHLPFDDWWKNHLSECVVLLSDTDFADFVKLSTEVITRIKINNDTGTVEQGALFTEEYLPTDSVLYSMLIAESEFSRRKAEDKMSKEAVFQFMSDQLPAVFQIGGNASIGKGIVKRSRIRAISYTSTTPQP